MVPCEFLSVVVDCFHCLAVHDLDQVVSNLFCPIDLPFNLSFGLKLAFGFKTIEIAVLNLDCMDHLIIVEAFNFFIRTL